MGLGKQSPSRFWTALAASLTIYLAIAAYVVLRSVAIGDGTPIYYLDDAYIHFAMARNLAEAGVYGVTPHAFTASSTSPAWVALLALGFLIVGSSIYVPLAMAAISCVLALGAGIRIVAGHANGWATMATGLALAVLTPLPLLTIQGMEHGLHAFGMLIAGWWLARRLTGEPPARPPLALGLALFAFLPLLRWESLWLVALAVALMLWRRRWIEAGALFGAAAVTICSYGLWSMAQGWPFLPASVLTKTMLSAPLDYWNLRHIVGVLFYHPAVKFTFIGDGMGLAALMLVAAAALAWRCFRRRSLWQPPAVFAALFVAGSWLHSLGGSFGWGYRYEAYMYALGIVAVALSAAELVDLGRTSLRRSRLIAAAGAVIACLLAVPVGLRAYWALGSIERNMQLVLDRDHYPARLVAGNFPGEAVVASNLGVLAWYHRGEIVDLFGLGTREITQFNLAGGVRTPQMFDRWAAAHNARIAIIFEADYVYLAGGQPHWIPVARVNVAFTSPLEFGLYAKDEVAARRLAQAVKVTPIPRGSTDTVRLLPPYDRP